MEAVKYFGDIIGWRPFTTKRTVEVQQDSSYIWVEGNQTTRGTMGTRTQKTCAGCPSSIAYFVKSNTTDTLFFPYSVSGDTLILGGNGILLGTSVAVEGITTLFIKIK